MEGGTAVAAAEPQQQHTQPQQQDAQRQRASAQQLQHNCAARQQLHHHHHHQQQQQQQHQQQQRQQLTDEPLRCSLLDEPLRCSLLLRLPDPGLEAAFWADPRTIRTLMSWDTFACLNVFIAQLIILRVLAPVLAMPGGLAHTWHMFAEVGLNLVTCSAALASIRCFPAGYRSRRQRFVAFNRALRLACQCCSAWQSSAGLQRVLAAVVNKPAGAGATAAAGAAAAVGGGGARGALGVALMAAVTNVTRPLSLMPLINMTQGNWFVGFQPWLLLQLANLALIVFGAQRHVPCRMVTDPSSGALVRPTCAALHQLHQLAAGAVLGVAFLDASPFSSSSSSSASSSSSSSSSSSFPASASASSATAFSSTSTSTGSGLSTLEAVCGDPRVAAAVLLAYAHAMHTILIMGAGFARLEWRLKCSWARQVLGRPLAYAPLTWRRSSSSSGGSGLGWWRGSRRAQAQQPQPAQDGAAATPLLANHHSSSSSSSGGGSTGAAAASGLAARGKPPHVAAPGVMLWVVGAVAGSGLLWLAAITVVPRLPPAAPHCLSCEEAGTCLPIAPCDGLFCTDPGLLAALSLLLHMSVVVAQHIFIIECLR